MIALVLIPSSVNEADETGLSSVDADPKNDSTNENNQISLYLKARVYNNYTGNRKKQTKNPKEIQLSEAKIGH